MPTIKNIIIFLAIAAAFVLIYMYFIKKDPAETGTLVSSSGVVSSTGDASLVAEENSEVAREFLTLLLNVKNIKLDDAIFSDNSFLSLHDSSIILIPDGNEGRINPFAPLGVD